MKSTYRILFFTRKTRPNKDGLVTIAKDNATEIDTDDSTLYVDLKHFVPGHNAQVIPKEKVGEILPWVHIVISNAKR